MSVTVVYRSAADLNRAEYWYEEGPKLQIEVEKLCKVADAARSVAGFDPCHDANSYWSIKKLSNALDEYDKTKEVQDGKSI